MWKLGLWPRNFFSGNIHFEFSVLCLRSAASAPFIITSTLLTFSPFYLRRVYAHILHMQVHAGFIAAREASLKLMRKKQLKIMQPGQLMR
jgi:hypothetical protein